MNWNLEGKRVIARYLGEHMCCGDVIESRVAYGGRIKHTLQLVKPIVVYGEKRETVVVKGDEIEAAWIPDCLEFV